MRKELSHFSVIFPPSRLDFADALVRKILRSITPPPSPGHFYGANHPKSAAPQPGNLKSGLGWTQRQRRKIGSLRSGDGLFCGPQWILQFQDHYEAITQPFEWRFTRYDLLAPLTQLEEQQPRLPMAASPRKHVPVISAQSTQEASLEARARQAAGSRRRRRAGLVRAAPAPAARIGRPVKAFPKSCSLFVHLEPFSTRNPGA